MIVGIIRRKPVLTHASIVCGGMLASVNSVTRLMVIGQVSGGTCIRSEKVSRAGVDPCLSVCVSPRLIMRPPPLTERWTSRQEMQPASHRPLTHRSILLLPPPVIYATPASTLRVSYQSVADSRQWSNKGNGWAAGRASGL